jgi:hypothetical protein
MPRSRAICGARAPHQRDVFAASDLHHARRPRRLDGLFAGSARYGTGVQSTAGGASGRP